MCVCVSVHFVQASAQIDSIMKGQVRDWRANLYILARHVSKKDIPLCHNVGQLAHTHTHTQYDVKLDAKRKSRRKTSGYPCSSSIQATGNRVSVKCQAMATAPPHPLSPFPLLCCAGNTCDQARLCLRFLPPQMPNANFIYEYDFWQQTIAPNTHTHTYLPYNKNPKILVWQTHTNSWRDGSTSRSCCCCWRRVAVAVAAAVLTLALPECETLRLWAARVRAKNLPFTIYGWLVRVLK